MTPEGAGAEERATRIVGWLVHPEQWPWLHKRLVKEINAASAAATEAEFERLYGIIVGRISADIAGNFEMALDQLEYNVAAAATAKERERCMAIVKGLHGGTSFCLLRIRGDEQDGAPQGGKT